MLEFLQSLRVAQGTGNDSQLLLVPIEQEVQLTASARTSESETPFETK